MATEVETTQVLICGCGPTGAMLSGFLGRNNVSNVILEKENDITTDPRGIALDNDGIRLLQALGLYDAVFTDIGSYVPWARFISGVHTDLPRKPFLYFNTGSTAGNTGHVGVLCHKQPALEKHLRSLISAWSYSSLRSKCTLASISKDDDWVYSKYLDSSGVERQIRSKFLVGADGKTGYTRKKYLEPKGVHMQWAERTKYQKSWVALNWRINLPTPETHPDFPLWEKGHTPQQVYDAFFPRPFSFLCNPDRPAVCGRFGLESDRLWRLEFVVQEGEDDNEMAKPEMIRKVVFPYLRHPGSRYGLSEDIEFPEDCIQVLRCRPFRFYARSCDKWALGRVILCGDAAHVFPPFGGQGIASGFRDAVALSWRLALICKSSTGVDHQKLLTGWFLERKQQLETSLASTVRNGDMVNSKNPVITLLRDWGLWLVQLIPTVRKKLELGARAYGLAGYKYADGMGFVAELGGGVSFAQSFCVELEGDKENGRVQFTGDVIFAPEKKNMFQVVVLLDGLDQVPNAQAQLDGLGSICSHLSTEEATYFIQRKTLSANTVTKEVQSGAGVFRTASAIEFSESDLSAGRPEAEGYREDDMWRAVKHKTFAIVRLDRFVFAACNGRTELEMAARKMAEIFPF
ncbi:hypothetical protein B0J15DRAFT_517711 [Fusarium solani]|uniref:FAD-binding domain-containing protein n=1 Tax=Fusarium solani TaxID=169388 RepID=A0A9P9G3R9_FUSSL|nr:uncharacterized protein B0J15DRAFT_517711 [Fusarium solani]KAH7231993.1 hypothetical protein B0J15DRAFT_517711 [Fusarium solani]